MPERIIISKPEGIANTLMVGLPLVVEKKMSTEKKPGVLAGWMTDEYVIVSLYNTFLPLTGFFKNNSATVKYLDLGIIYAFQAVVKEVVKGMEAVFFTWPKHVEAVTLASVNRVKVRYPVTLSFRVPFEIRTIDVDATIFDLSTKGCQVRVPKQSLAEEMVSAGQKVTMSLYLPNQTTANLVQAEIRNISAMGDYFTLGLLFRADGHSEQIKRIEQIVRLQLQA
ncbi:MAG: PilZ domain-containing protein [Deltaproteobacteria bacterium]|nr:PilZ domain-containing protein [Deltaproteobacteria bacterium]MBF0525840.1 PilZ domain-containing protein [Deltaproteobacteria bacterium]